MDDKGTTLRRKADMEALMVKRMLAAAAGDPIGHRPGVCLQRKLNMSQEDNLQDDSS